MIIDEFYIVRIGVGPPNTEAPLLVDPNAPLAAPITSELLEPIGGRHTQVVERSGGIEHTESPQGNVLEFRTPAPHRFTSEQPAGILVAEAADHVI